MRLPNGYGSVTKQGGKRRNPYIVRKTVGYRYDEEKDKFVQDMMVIGYARTKAEGLKLLSEYNQAPYDTRDKTTFSMVYDMWAKQKYPTISKTNSDGYHACYKVCQELYDIPFRDIKLSDLQHVVDASGKNFPTLKKLKMLMSQLYSFAIKHEICQKDYSRYVDVLRYKDRTPIHYIRERFENSELELLWEQKDDMYFQVILMLIYSGVRVSELLELKKSDVHLDAQYFDVVKSKTEAGVRVVPIADKLLPMYKSWMELRPECETLIHTPGGEPFQYKNYYRRYFTPYINHLNFDRTPHCCRHTFVSLMTEAGVDPRIIKIIVGHSTGMSVTEKVYTHLDIRTLIDSVNKIAT